MHSGCIVYIILIYAFVLISYFDTSVSIVFATGFQFDYVFDWTILKYQQSQLATPPTRALVIFVLC